MGLPYSGISFTSGKTYKNVKNKQPGYKAICSKIIVPDDVREHLSSLPEIHTGGKTTVMFTQFEDFVLLTFSKMYSLKYLAKCINKKPTTVGKRYKVLMGLPLGSYSSSGA
jgi:hypothetical protein